MTTTPLKILALSLLALGLSSPRALAQSSPSSPLLELPNLGPVPGAFEPNLPPSPGALAPSPFSALDSGIIGGRRRGGGRVPRSAGKVRQPPKANSRLQSSAPLDLPPLPPETQGINTSAYSSSLSLPSIVDDQGAPSGITLDAAIEHMLHHNLDLQALKFEIPQADADILTAGLRANPILYVDSQFIPYGSFTSVRPGGPTQYDANLTIPLDLSQKRQSRVQVANAAKSVLQAQYQDVVRRQIGNLYRAFIDLQAARTGFFSAQAALINQSKIIERESKKAATSSDSRLAVQLDKARAGVEDARDTLADAREALALILNLPPEQAQTLEPKGSLRTPSSALPPLEDLLQIARTHRPDLTAARLGLGRAEAEVHLARANRLDDVYLFYDPITYQDNTPSKVKSSRSWDVGLAVPLPIFNRNQGNIARARGNVSQTQTELLALQRRLNSEVRQAHREYRSSKAAVAQLERTVLPNARIARDKANAEFAAGAMDDDEYLGQLSDDGDTTRLYREAVIRHRRAALDLNTALGLRLLP